MRLSVAIFSVFLLSFVVVLSSPVSAQETASVFKSFTPRELAIRSVGLAQIPVLPAARQYIPKGFETALLERVVAQMSDKTYLEPKVLSEVLDRTVKSAALTTLCAKNQLDAILVFEIDLEEIKGFIATASGFKIRTFNFKYRVDDLKLKNSHQVLADRILDSVVQTIPYRGFVTALQAEGATVNLGTKHSVKEGDILELFEFRRGDIDATHRPTTQVKIEKVLGPSESLVRPMDPGDTKKIELFAKIRFSVSPNPITIVATDPSIVSGNWWFGFGGELNSFGAEAAAIKYEPRILSVNGAPFGYLAGGNDLLSIRTAFGSARSSNETINFFDAQGTYSLYQIGGAQSSWTLSAGARVLAIQVAINAGSTSNLESSNVISPLAELKYRYVPRGRIRIFGSTELFWPIYSSGAQVSALIFAFGIGAGGGLQIAMTPKFGFEVFGKIRYLRRLIEGQSGVQERQSLLGAGLVFSF